MARDGSGTYNLPAGQPVSTGTTISSTVHNTLASDVAAALTQSLSKDGQTTPTANLPMGGFKFTGVADGSASNQFATVGQLQSAAVSLAGSVSGTDTITANLNPAILSYTSGLFVSLIVANTNATTTPTLALNGLSAKTIVRSGGQALAIGDLVTTKLAHMQYDGTNFVLLNPATATYPAFIPTSSTVPANGMYLSAANTVALASNTTLRWSVNSTGNHVFAVPSSGVALAVTGLAAGTAQTWSDSTRTLIVAMATNAQIGTSSAHGFSLLSAGNERVVLASAGNVTINAPSSGVAAAINGFNGSSALTVQDSLIPKIGLLVGGTERGYLQYTDASSILRLDSDGSIDFAPNNTVKFSISSAGNVTLATPSSGTTLTVNGLAQIVGTGSNSGGTSEWDLYNTSNTANSSALFYLSVAGSSAGNPFLRFNISGVSDWSAGVDNADSDSFKIAASSAVGSASVLRCSTAGILGYYADAGATAFEVGFRGIPQNAQTGNYTLVLADAGKHIYHAAAAGAGDTYTIPANGSVAYDIGTAITFINRDTTNAVSIAITTDTLTLAGVGATGTRTLAAYGMATAVKVTSTEWMISGTGLT